MDILYIVGDGSRFNNLELRMSLRSICKYGTNIGKVIVAGNPPQWLSDKVIKIKIEDKYTYKHQNILSCIENVIDMELVHGDFLYSSDDHFYCRPVDFANYPYFVKGELRRTFNLTDTFWQYHQSLYDTRKLCQKYNLPAMDYSQHCNTHMNTDVFRSIRNIIHESYKLPYGVEPTSIIMNAWQTLPNPPKLTPRKDIKITEADTVESILEQIGDRDCFSISDGVFKQEAMSVFFCEEFPIKTVFEAF